MLEPCSLRGAGLHAEMHLSHMQFTTCDVTSCKSLHAMSKKGSTPGKAYASASFRGIPFPGAGGNMGGFTASVHPTT